MPTITTTVTSAQATGAVTTVTTTEATPEPGVLRGTRTDECFVSWRGGQKTSSVGAAFACPAAQFSAQTRVLRRPHGTPDTFVPVEMGMVLPCWAEQNSAFAGTAPGVHFRTCVIHLGSRNARRETRCEQSTATILGCAQHVSVSHDQSVCSALPHSPTPALPSAPPLSATQRQRRGRGRRVTSFPKLATGRRTCSTSSSSRTRTT